MLKNNQTCSFRISYEQNVAEIAYPVHCLRRCVGYRSGHAGVTVLCRHVQFVPTGRDRAYRRVFLLLVSIGAAAREPVRPIREAAGIPCKYFQYVRRVARLRDGAQPVDALFGSDYRRTLAAGNISTAQSALSDIANDRQERMNNLGSIGAVFGIGFIVGPLIGGFLGSIDHRLPFQFVAGLAFINFVLAVFRLPETRKGDHAGSFDWSLVDPTLPVRNAFKDRSLRLIFVAWFLFGMAFAAQQSVFALYMGRLFGFGEAVVGLFMTGVGVMIALNQGFLLKNFWLKRFTEHALEPVLLVSLSIAFLIMGLPWFWALTVGIVLLAAVQPVIRVIMNGRFANDDMRRGELLGMSVSVMSLSMIVGPVAAGWLFEIRPFLPFVFASAVVALSLVLLCRNRGAIA